MQGSHVSIATDDDGSIQFVEQAEMSIVHGRYNVSPHTVEKTNYGQHMRALQYKQCDLRTCSSICSAAAKRQQQKRLTIAVPAEFDTPKNLC